MTHSSIYENNRERMVEEQLVSRGISDEKTLMALRTIPRHLFVEDALRTRAYGDHPLPIGVGQTISQPYIVAAMTSLLRVRPGDVVLEIGTGSGFITACLAALSRRVVSVELHEELYREAKARLDAARPKTIAGQTVTGILTRDGYKYMMGDDNWLLIRFSGTEPIIRVYCETTDQDLVQPLLDAGLDLAGLK